jgi:hypothetical protein
MAILSNSWAKHLKNLGGDKDANKHMKAFTNALAPSKTIPKQVNALIKDVDAGILLVGPKNSILQTHSWKCFGGTRSRPDYDIFCLIGMGPIGQGVSVDTVSVTSAYPISILSATEISNCRTVLDFEGLGINVSDLRPATNAGIMLESTAAEANSQDLHEIPVLNLTPEHASGDTTKVPPQRPTKRSLGEETAEAATEQAITAATTRMSNTTAAAGGRGGRQGSRGGQEGTQRVQEGQGGCGSTRLGRGGAAAATGTQPQDDPTVPPTEDPNQTLEIPLAFIMAPFLCDAIFGERSTDPLELIIIAREAATKFDARHRDVARFEGVLAADHVKAFTNWAIALNLGRLREARVIPDSDNCALQAWSDTRNESCILPAITTVGGTIGQGVNIETFRILGEGLKRMGEAADEANVLKRKEIKQRNKESDQKKDRIKDMHPSISNMILMASSVDS